MDAALDINHLQKSKLIKTVYAYLNGGDTGQIRTTLAQLCNDTESDAKSLYQSILTYPDIEDTLFDMLRVPKDKQKNYRDKINLFSLLTHLHQDGWGHGHLSFLLTLINDTTYHHYRGTKSSILSSIMLINTGAFFYRYPQYFHNTLRFISTVLPRIILEWVKKTFSILQNITFIGMSYTTFMFLIFLYKTFYHGLSNLNQKLTAVFFRGSATGLSMAGYILCFLAAGVATPLTGILFISGSAIDVVESVISYLMIRLKPMSKKDVHNQTWHDIADQARQESQRKQAGKSVWIKLSAALIVTAIVAIWCFFPPSLVLTLTCMAAISVIGVVKSLILSSIESKYTEKLQKTLQTAAQSLAEDDTQSPVSSNAIAPSSQKKLKLNHQRPDAQPEQNRRAPQASTVRGTFFSHKTPSTKSNHDHALDEESAVLGMPL
jgi:hypothetical protein